MASLPPSHAQLFAFGDIHGRLDLLQQLIVRIHAEREAESQCIFLGDYIDRGLYSRQVIDTLLELEACEKIKPVFLLGNHEQVMRNILRNDDLRLLLDWMRFGGIETLLSYGIRPPANPSPKAAETVLDAMKARVPPSHVAFLERLAPSHMAGDYFFCHAGVRPGVALDRQHENDLAWIRQDFLAHHGPYEKMIVHGHTIAMQPERLPHRINIDTGAYATSVLTCLALHEDRQWLLQT